MLKFYRKNIKLFIWIIVLSFVAWGVGTLSFSKDQSSSYAGSIGGEKISLKEFMTTFRFYDLLSRAHTAQVQEGPAQQTPKTEPPSYDQLRMLTWQELLVSREAKRDGITVSDGEVRGEIERLFSENGQFNPDAYRFWIEHNFRGRPRDFEETVRNYLASRKLRDQILSGVPESERQSHWTNWLISLYARTPFKDYTEKEP